MTGRVYLCGKGTWDFVGEGFGDRRIDPEKLGKRYRLVLIHKIYFLEPLVR